MSRANNGVRRRALTAFAALAAITACRDGVAPFTPEQRVFPDSARALTFGYGQDADPRWLPGGDTLIYHTNLFGAATSGAGILVRIPAAGGSAAPIFADVQVNLGRPLATPAVSPAGGRIAYMDLLGLDRVDGTCFRNEFMPNGQEADPGCRSIQPLLDSAVLRVRTIGALGSMFADPHIGVRFSGTDANHRFGVDLPWIERLFPFQAEYRAENAILFRPGWAPDGERIIYSDGLSLRVWRIGDSISAMVPNTADGVSAAWSPDGQWIAFALIPRADSTTYTCLCVPGPGAPVYPAFRTVYSEGPRTLVIIRPDGTGRTELGAGDDPAWSPDGAYIYARRGTNLVRMAVAGGAVITIPNTTNGRAPAVSPDGRRLAFSRRKSQLTTDYDIWVVSLEQ